MYGLYTMILHYTVKLVNTQGVGLRRLAGLLSEVPSQMAVLYPVGLWGEAAGVGTPPAHCCPVDLSALMEALRDSCRHSVVTGHLLLFST